MKKTRLIFACAAATLLTVGGLTSCQPGTAEVLQYNVNKEDVTGANITLDKTSAKVGELVTVTVEVTDTTKTIDKVFANSLAVGANEEGKYVFAMPNGEVKVKVTLKNKEVPLTYTANIETVDGVTLTLNKTTGLKAGETVTGKAVSTDTTKFVSHVLVGDSEVALKDKEGNFTFVMPDKNVSVKGVLELIPVEATFNATVIEVEGAKVTLTNGTDVKAGTIVNGTVEVSASDKVIEHVLVGDTKVTPNSDGTFSFAMPAKDINVTVVLKDAEVLASYNATITVVEGVTVTLNKSEGLLPGEEVSGAVTVTDQTKLLSHVLVSTQKVFVNENNEFTFVVPNKNVTVEAVLVDDPAKVLHPLLIADNCKNDTRFKGYFVDPTTKEVITEAVNGATVRLYLENIQTTEVTHDVTDIRVNTTSGSVSARDVDIRSQLNSASGLRDYYYDFTFTSDVKNVSFFPSKLKYDIQYSFKGCSVILENETKKANAGDTVKIYPRVASNFEVKDVVVKDIDDNVITVTEKHILDNRVETREVYYEFVMPAKKAYVTINCVATSECVYVTTDGHSEVSNFRNTNDAAGTTEVVESNSTMNLAYTAKEGEKVYFNVKGVTTPEGVEYAIKNVYYSTDNWATKKEANFNETTGIADFTMPRGNVEIKVESKQAYVPFTVDTPEGTKLEIFLKKGSEYVLCDGKLPASYERLYIKFTDTNATEDEFLDMVKLEATEMVNGQPRVTNLLSGTSLIDGYIAKWFEPKGESMSLKVTTESKKIIFKNKEFLGTYKGGKLSKIDGWYEEETETHYAQIEGTGAYYCGTSSSWSLGKDILTLDADGKTLTSGSTKFIYDNGWLIKPASSLNETVILKKDYTGTYSDVKLITIDGTSTKALVEQTFGSQKYYHFVDLTTSTFYAECSLNYLSGTSLSTGTVVEVKNATEVITTLQLTSSTKAETAVNDGLAGTYKVAEGGTSNLGDVTLNGFGKATVTGFEFGKYDYTVEGNVITLTGTDRGATAIVSRKITIDKDAKTFTDTNLQTDLTNFSSANLVSKTNVVGSDGKTYQFKISLNETNIEISYYEVVDGVVSTTRNRLTDYYCDALFDLSGKEIKVRINETGNFVGYETLDMVYKTGETGPTLTISGTGLKSNKGTVTFDLTNVEFVKA